MTIGITQRDLAQPRTEHFSGLSGISDGDTRLRLQRMAAAIELLMSTAPLDALDPHEISFVEHARQDARDNVPLPVKSAPVIEKAARLRKNAAAGWMG